MTDETAKSGMVVYDFSGAPPAGAVDGTLELLSDEILEEDRAAEERHPRRSPIVRFKLDAGGPTGA